MKKVLLFLLLATPGFAQTKLGVAHGGTGANALTINDLLVGNGTSAVTLLSTVNNGVLITNGSGVPSWLGAGTNTYVLTMVSGAPAWAAASGGGFTNPMTTLGDIIYENATPAPARLAGQKTAAIEFLSQTGTGTVSTAPAWSTFVTNNGSFGSFYGGVGAGHSGSAGTLNTAIGNAALSTITSGSHNVAIGDNVAPYITTGSGNVFIGTQAGRNSPVGENETFESGSDTNLAGFPASIKDVYFGSGKQTYSGDNPCDYTIHGSGAAGTNIAGGTIRIAGGLATGNAPSGPVTFSSAVAVASGTTAQTLSEIARFDTAGLKLTDGFRVPILAKSANYTTLNSDYFVSATGGAGGITITLTASPNVGQVIVVAKVDAGAGTVTVAANTGQSEFGGSLTLASQGACDTYTYIGGNVWIGK